ncbi:MAG: hypothetical protein LBP65_03210 [Puniceicoccales bacterium]|jgi:hypothetical protein|nr:hypothetical protein [Puniceicoccales bacterium]
MPAFSDLCKAYLGPWNLHGTAWRGTGDSLVSKEDDLYPDVSGAVIFTRYVATSLLLAGTVLAAVGAGLAKAGALNLVLVATVGAFCGMTQVALLVSTAVVLGILTIAVGTFGMLYFAPRWIDYKEDSDIIV